MPTFAILGATGATGQAVLQLLQEDQTSNIHCFVRNKKKLFGQVPHLDLQNNKRIKVFEGSLKDIPLLAECVAPCDAIFMCVATNPHGLCGAPADESQENSPDCNIALDSAHSVVASLSHVRIVMKKPDHEPLPRVIVLSSGSINDYLCRETPSIARNVVWAGLYYIYADLIKAEEYYRLNSAWMTAVFVQPGGLVQDAQKGHEVTTEKESQAFLSFLDLAAGMIECAKKPRDDTVWDWRGISVLPTGNTRFNPMAPLAILRGMVWTACPPLYWAFHKAGLV